ncbi:hypothetical protein HDU93_006419 [Gonapodya sp. JEL0774]|nr:hypothetical protein HDU93_006419 [Gonapodya sp. JEL0774]
MERVQGLAPRNAVAIQTGSASGIVVVDVDDIDGWSRVLSQYSQVEPNTVTARSQRGGYHYYFEHSEKVADLKSTSHLLGGCVDLRNSGGMIISPPSTFQVPGEPSVREYTWVSGKAPWEQPLSEMPDWLVRALRESGGGGGTVRVTLDAGGGISENAVVTPDIVKQYIVDCFGVLLNRISELKRLESGYVIATSILECHFINGAHKSNRQYLHITHSGEITRRCHDGACSGQTWGAKKLPSNVLTAIRNSFAEQMSAPEKRDITKQRQSKTTPQQRSSNKLDPAELIRTIDASIVDAQPVLNRALKAPVGTEWDIGDSDKSSLIPRCVMCLVNPNHAHEHTGESFLRLNTDMTVDAVCRELGELRLKGPVARSVQTAFHVNVLIQEDTKEYEGLRDEVVSYGLSRGLQREKGSGWVYRPINGLSYALERWKSPEDYVNIVFWGDKEQTFTKRASYFDNLVSYICKADHECFPFLERNMRYYGFRNGVYDVESCEFIPTSDVPWNVVARKYIDQEFTGSTETPLFDSIFRAQGHGDDVLQFVDVCLGRLFGIRDDWQFMLLLYGESGTGKSTVLSVMRSFFEQVGSLSSTFERTFGLSAWYDKEIVLGDDLPVNMTQVLPQAVMQSMISNGELTVVPKGKTAFSVTWKVPLLFATNFALDYIDQGQVSRRVLVLSFLERVRVVAPDLVSRIVREELPAILKRVTMAYKKALELNGGRGVWDFTPPYFIEGQREMRMQSDPVFAFIMEHCEYREGSLVTIKTLKEAIRAKTGKVAPSRISHQAVESADERYKISRIMMCKACGNEGKKGCCDDFKASQRTSTDAVKHMVLRQ